MTAQRNSSSGETRRQPTGRGPKVWSGPVALLLVVAALWWQWAQTQKQSQGGKAAPGVSSLTAAAVSGVWRGEVTYSWGPTHTERFLFQVEGDKLFGTASFLGFKRGIEDGRIDGNKISFSVTFQSAENGVITERKYHYTGTIAGNEIRFIIRFHEAVEGMSTERTNRYAGSVSGNQIHFRMEDDRGKRPVEFVVRKETRAE